jgi:hypothetical protein
MDPLVLVVILMGQILYVWRFFLQLKDVEVAFLNPLKTLIWAELSFNLKVTQYWVLLDHFPIELFVSKHAVSLPSSEYIPVL